MTAPRLFLALLLVAILFAGSGVAPGAPEAEALQAPKISLDMVTAGNSYDDATNTMTVGSIDDCLATKHPGNLLQHSHPAHLIIQDVEDVVGWQARLNYDGGKMRPSTANFSPFLDNNTGQNVSFLNLPLDAATGVHRNLVSATSIPPGPAVPVPTPQTALVGAVYSGGQTAAVSADTPAKAAPDDTSYGAPAGGVLASIQLQVQAGLAGWRLSMDLDDGDPNSPGSSVVVFTGSGTTSIDLTETDLGDGLHAEGTSCEEPIPQLLAADMQAPPPELPGEPGVGGAPSSTQTSEFMAGRAAYSVVFVESSGGSGNCVPADPQTENWDAGRIFQVLQQINIGLAGFWQGRDGKPVLDLVEDNLGVQPTSCEPITRSSSEEGKWIADVLKALGRNSATPVNYFFEARALAHSRRIAQNADWGFLIFVVDSLNDDGAGGAFSNGAFAYAYVNGPFMVMTFDNDGWGINRMHIVTAHEAGHIFGDLDEYAASNCTTSQTSGYLGVPNASCNNGGITSDTSIMGEANEQEIAIQDPNGISDSARHAVGWRDPQPGVPLGSTPRTVVDVVRNRQLPARTTNVSITQYSPDPTSDTTPTFSATGYTQAFPPGGGRAPVTIAKYERVEWKVDGGPFQSGGVAATDGVFDEDIEPYTFTPQSQIRDGTHTFCTQIVTNFGDWTGPVCDSLTIDRDLDGVVANDNCFNVANPDQANIDPDGVGDACDPGDFDGDGFSDRVEYHVGTHRGLLCGTNAWPADINNSGFADTGDIAMLTNDFGDAVPAAAPARHDIAPDPPLAPPNAFVDTKDIARMTGLFGHSCGTITSYGCYHPVTPARILDTRTGPGPTGPAGAGDAAAIDVNVMGVGGVPASGVAAVVVNATVTQATAPSYLTVYPSGAARPPTSNLNFAAGETIANLVTVEVGADGNVTVYNNSGQTHVIFDIAGWYGVPGGGSRYNPLTPKRILDTRNGTGAPAAKIGPNTSLTVDVTDTYGSGVPATGVTAVAVHAAVIEPTAASYLTVYPSDASAPIATNLNFLAGQTVSNLAVVKVGVGGAADGKVNVYNNAGSTHVIFDVVGWYGGIGDVFHLITPSRVLDTRSAPQGVPPGAVGANSEILVDVTGVGSLPVSGASSVVVNGTVTQPTANSFLTVYPSGVTRPDPASTLNFAAGQTVANLQAVKVGADGNVKVYNAAGQTHVIFDAVGYFGP